MPETDAKRRTRPKFPPFEGPRFTQVPDALFDVLLPELTGAELKVLLYIIRRTFGFKRDADDISLSQMLNGIQKRDGTILDRGVGLSKKSLLQALRDLEEMNLIIRERRSSEEAGNQPTNYRLNVAGQTPGVESTPPLGEKVHQGGGEESTPSPRGKKYTTQYTVEQHTGVQETAKQNTDTISNSFELVANMQKTSNFQNSKKRDKSFDVTDSRRSGAGDFTAVGQVLASSKASTTDRKTSRRPGKGARTAEDAQGDAYYQSSQNRPATGTRGRPPKATEQIEAVLEQISDEFHDGEHLPSNIGQAARLWKASGLSESSFVSRLYEARAITKDYGMSIHKKASGEAGEWGMRNRMPYFFAVVRDLLGMKESGAP